MQANKSGTAYLRADHARFKDMFKNVLESQDSNYKTTQWNQLVKEMVQHEMVEEEVAHPIYVMVSKDKSIRDESLHQEADLNTKLKAIEFIKGSDPDFNTKVKSFYDSVLQHMKHEEEKEFPVLESKLAENYLADMESVMTVLKNVVPTRPHPMAPQKPSTGQTIIGPVQGLIDRITDYMTKEFPPK
eukprot:TRINITY_DN2142_c0_g1_i1.p1 TRINITY_DN2142_c0_g1~~TRINITY_DN2142_c0_g1_i1.p1  ORF type:complete len:213 (+),score=50.64 TRINITY_DN2142_c0_g1_i1:79-639(+)